MSFFYFEGPEPKSLFLSSLEDHPRITLDLLTLKVNLLYPPHAIVMRLYRRDVSYVCVLISETADRIPSPRHR